jgi:hypothetical protein
VPDPDQLYGRCESEMSPVYVFVKSPNNTSKWQMEFNSAFKGLKPLSVDSSPNTFSRSLRADVTNDELFFLHPLVRIIPVWCGLVGEGVTMFATPAQPSQTCSFISAVHMFLFG